MSCRDVACPQEDTLSPARDGMLGGRVSRGAKRWRHAEHRQARKREAAQGIREVEDARIGQRASDPSIQRSQIAVRTLSGVPTASRSEIPDARYQVARDGDATEARERTAAERDFRPCFILVRLKADTTASRSA